MRWTSFSVLSTLFHRRCIGGAPPDKVRTAPRWHLARGRGGGPGVHRKGGGCAPGQVTRARGARRPWDWGPAAAGLRQDPPPGPGPGPGPGRDNCPRRAAGLRAAGGGGFLQRQGGREGWGTPAGLGARARASFWQTEPSGILSTSLWSQVPFQRRNNTTCIANAIANTIANTIATHDGSLAAVMREGAAHAATGQAQD